MNLTESSSGELPTNSWESMKNEFIKFRIRDREISCDTEKENMHLYLSEMLIGAMESLKFEETHKTDFKSTNANAEIRTRKNCGFPQISSDSTELCSSAVCGLNDMSMRRAAMQPKIREMEHDLSRIAAGDDECFEDESSAETAAASLLRHLSNLYPREADSDVQWLILPFPSEKASFSDEMDSKGRVIHLRGSDDWAPPRKQWIFILHPHSSSIRYLLDVQCGRCAGCGMKVGKIYARRMQYCDYYGRLFCQRCHQGSKLVIPARIVHQWNFKEYPVCDLAYRFLRSNHYQPVINASAIYPRFYEHSRSLKKLQVWRIQIGHIWSYIKTCELALSVETKFGSLAKLYNSLPSHYLWSYDVFSMNDFENIQYNGLPDRILPLVEFGELHVENCEKCKAKAFICELCKDYEDLLFPFQLLKVRRCDHCGSLSHIKCARKYNDDSSASCRKCLRIQINLERHQHTSEDSLSASEEQFTSNKANEM